ncbi:MAG: TaqI-like C-terminal specificity domain-containing protein [Bacteroidia bacterium]
MKNFDSAFSEIKTLVEDFKAGEKHYLSPSYQEAEVRKDFIDKFFIALGWDVHHDHQKDPYGQEVKVEKGMMMSGAQKRADYSFAFAPNYSDAKFFVEAKKPSHDLYNADYYFQTIRYGWHKATPLAALTDFEEFHILDCRFGPDISTVLNRQFKRFHYSEYADKEKFAEIYWLFSREAVANNSIAKIAERLPKPKGKGVKKALSALEKYQTIDEEFLNVIEDKREILAKALKRNNEDLNGEELTEATQKIIDRLVFIRFLEDKLIEQEHYVHQFGEKGKAWDDFIAVCKKLDVKYNGIVFKRNFIDDNKFIGPVDSEFHAVCQDLCHLKSKFLFNQIPIHILGSIYERFLGKVVHATDKRVKIEEKPEVRKAGGVYYTPKYIVDYIVQNTIGKLIENKTPEQISKLHFADIACGSGSFLIGVFDCLLTYHNKYYQHHPDKAKKDGCLFKEDLWILSLLQKQNILRNNIYGVDIDSQAVEVTQLSLSLKMLEDETTATANEMQVLFHEKILPDMSRNIVCGNSLIGTDILTRDLFSEENLDERKLNPMDFESAFPHIFKRGTTVIEKTKTKIKVEVVERKIASVDVANSSTPIIEAEEFPQPHLKKNKDDIDLLHEPIVAYGNKNDSWGFDAIVGNPPYRLMQPKEIDSLTLNYFRDHYTLAEFKIDLFHLFLQKAISISKLKGLTGYIIPSSILNNVYAQNLREWIRNNSSIKIISLTREKVFTDADVYTCVVVFEKGVTAGKEKVLTSTNLEQAKNGQKISYKKIDQSRFGNTEGKVWNILLNDENIKIIDKVETVSVKLNTISNINRGLITGDRNKYFSDKKVNNKYVPIFAGSDIFRYFSNSISEYVLFERPSTSGGCWDKTVHFADNKILIRQIGFEPTATFIDEPIAVTGNIFTIISNSANNNKFILGILNSKLIKFYWQLMFSDFKNSFPQVTIFSLNQLPIVKTGIENKKKMIQLVDQMLLAKKQLQSAKTDKDKSYYQNKCNTLDNQIDNLAYELYNISEDEINIIENKK